jgi:hypothetical protein
MGKRADAETVQPHIVESHVKEEQRQQEKRTGKDGKPGKAGKIRHKGGASTSRKESGGKMAR